MKRRKYFHPVGNRPTNRMGLVFLFIDYEVESCDKLMIIAGRTAHQEIFTEREILRKLDHCMEGLKRNIMIWNKHFDVYAAFSTFPSIV